MVHMIFASIFFQYAARNWKNPQQQAELTAKSNLHYHYSLGLLPQLMASHTLQVSISGKLGRPMPLRHDDLDIELPEPVEDETFDESNAITTDPSQYSLRVGVELMRMAPLYMEVFGSIYAIKRSPRSYIETVRRIDHRIGQWFEQVPNEWKRAHTREWPATEREEHVRALMINMYHAEILLLLHHPSLSLTSSVEFNNHNLDICMDVSHTMLVIVKILQEYVCLDTTWLNGAIFVLAMSTTLFGHWERKDKTTAAGLNTLRDDMNSWLSILTDVGALLGELPIQSALQC